jgi:hypothetical protein
MTCIISEVPERGRPETIVRTFSGVALISRLFFRVIYSRLPIGDDVAAFYAIRRSMAPFARRQRRG